MFLKKNEWLFTQFSLIPGNVKVQKQKGFHNPGSHRPISQQHVEKMYTDYFERHFDNDPWCLQHKVYFEIAFFLGKRGFEGLRDLKKGNFAVHTTDDSREYLEMTKRLPKSHKGMIIMK